MTQKEKSKLTYDKITNASLKEFGTKSYEAASINNICVENNISKGLLYHHFKSKDELYLNCVKLCFDSITEFISKTEFDFTDINNFINQILSRRMKFFEFNPYFRNIFFYAIIRPPAHLNDKIIELKQPFTQLNYKLYEKILGKLTLRNGITFDEAINYIFAFENMFNSYFKIKASEHADFQNLIEQHESEIARFANIFLHGILKETDL